MAKHNSERLLNLVIALLTTKRFLTREEIRQRVAGYGEAKSEAAFQKMFERDKHDLRQMGVEIKVGPADPGSDEQDGYRIEAGGFYLPEIRLTPAEATLAGLAASVWSEPTLAGQVSAAMTKLRAAGTLPEAEPASFLTPRLAAREPAFTVLWSALTERAGVGFTYHGQPRAVQPWRLIMRRGIWYLLGEDAGRGPRLFRLSRIEDQPVRRSGPGAYDPPPPEQIAAHAARLDPPTPTATVVVALRSGAAGDLRRRARPYDPATGRAADPATGTTADPTASTTADPAARTTAGPATGRAPALIGADRLPAGYELVEVAYAREDEIVANLLAAGPDALVVQAGLIRDQVLAQLRAVAQLDGTAGSSRPGPVAAPGQGAGR